MSRRERQFAEILLLSVDGDDQRAAALAAEHLLEFPLDADSIATVEDWVRDHRALDRRSVS